MCLQGVDLRVNVFIKGLLTLMLVVQMTGVFETGPWRMYGWTRNMDLKVYASGLKGPTPKPDPASTYCQPRLPQPLQSVGQVIIVSGIVIASNRGRNNSQHYS